MHNKNNSIQGDLIPDPQYFSPAEDCDYFMAFCDSKFPHKETFLTTRMIYVVRLPIFWLFGYFSAIFLLLFGYFSVIYILDKMGGIFWAHTKFGINFCDISLLWIIVFHEISYKLDIYHSFILF